MAGEKAVQNSLLEIVSGAHGARDEGRVFSADEGAVRLSPDGAVDSAFEARETLDARESFGAANLDQRATFAAKGGPIVTGDRRGVKTTSSLVRTVIGGIGVVAAVALVAGAAAFVYQFLTPDITVDLSRGVICNTPPGQSSILGMFRLLAGCP